MKKNMSKLCCALLLALSMSANSALAITGQEALGLGGSAAVEEGYGDDGATTTGYTVLQYGDRDGVDTAANVVMLQNRLISLGYLSSSADGQFGQATEDAVLSFQLQNGLTSTGIADSSTQSILFSDEAQRATPAEVADSELLRVQQKMSTWGFLSGRADGVLGNDTFNAVSSFKEYVYSTYANVYAEYRTAAPTAKPTLSPNEQPVAVDAPLTPTVEPDMPENGYRGDITEDVVRFVDGESTFNVYQTTVQSGASGNDVWRVQRRLHQLNYLYKPDGSYGDLTKYALMSFQQKNGLQATGIADRDTQEKLFSDMAILAEEYVFPYKLCVDLSSQRVYVAGWDGSAYTKEVAVFKCSTGKPGYDTPTGTYQSGGKCTAGQWYYFSDYGVYAKYATRIVGGVLFHSVLYSGSKKGPTSSSVSALGSKASHGCVRLAVDDAKWIFENCPEGTTIIVQQ